MTGLILWQRRFDWALVTVGVWSQFKLGVSWGTQSTLVIGPLEIEVERLP